MASPKIFNNKIRTNKTMEYKINILDHKKVENELMFRLEQYNYRVELAAAAMPILERYQGKKVTKHITTALDKELSKILPEEKFKGTYLRDGFAHQNARDTIRFQGTGLKGEECGRELHGWDNYFEIHLADIKYGDKEAFVDEDVKNFRWNKRYTDPKLIHKIRNEYFAALEDCETIVKENNETYKKVQEMYRKLQRNHEANQYAFR